MQFIAAVKHVMGYSFEVRSAPVVNTVQEEVRLLEMKILEQFHHSFVGDSFYALDEFSIF